MGQRGKGEGQRTTGKSEKRGHGWGGLRFFCLWVRFCSKEEQKEEQIKKKRQRKKSGEERKERVTGGREKGASRVLL